jgi:hypothetical protein
MLDPIKATIVTPGLDINGKFADPGASRPRSSPNTWLNTAWWSRRPVFIRSS